MLRRVWLLYVLMSTKIRTEPMKRLYQLWTSFAIAAIGCATFAFCITGAYRLIAWITAMQYGKEALVLTALFGLVWHITYSVKYTRNPSNRPPVR